MSRDVFRRAKTAIYRSIIQAARILGISAFSRNQTSVFCPTVTSHSERRVVAVGRLTRFEATLVTDFPFHRFSTDLSDAPRYQRSPFAPLWKQSYHRIARALGRTKRGGHFARVHPPPLSPLEPSTNTHACIETHTHERPR